MNNYIPIDKENLPEIFEIDLANSTYMLGINYNQSFDFFTVDLYDSNMTPIVLGEKMMINQPLWDGYVDERIPAPTLIPVDESGQADRVSYDNLMETVFLFVDDGSDDSVDEDEEDDD